LISKTVFGLALVAMVFILLVGMFSGVTMTMTANLFLVLFFIGWIPAALVLEYLRREVGSRSTRHTSRVRVAVVIGSAAVAVAALAIVVPLLTFPLPAAVSIGIMVAGFLPTSALALVRSSRRRRG
jgi:archaellum biogenesis protein FlaJ (TadC family)